MSLPESQLARSYIIKVSVVAVTLLILGACSSGPEDKVLTDCPDCPVMITIPAGSFMMGTAVADRADDPVSGRPNANEEPQHEVTFAQPFDMGKYEVTVAQRAALETAANRFAFGRNNAAGSHQINVPAGDAGDVHSRQ